MQTGQTLTGYTWRSLRQFNESLIMKKRERKPVYNWSVVVTRYPNGEPYYIGNVHSTTERGARMTAKKELHTDRFLQKEISFIRRSAVTYFNGRDFKTLYK